MTLVLSQDYNALKREQSYAHEKWGDEFDDRNTLNDWVTYSTMYATDAARMDRQDDQDWQYRMLIKSAGLLMAAATRVRERRLTARHYDVDKTLNPKPSGHGDGMAASLKARYQPVGTILDESAGQNEK